MEIRDGETSEIEKFQLYNEDNEGDEITVVEDAGQVVAYAKHTHGTIYFMESEQKGAGRFLMDWFKANYEHIVAVNVEKTAIGFYEKMGLSYTRRDFYGGLTYELWTEEE